MSNDNTPTPTGGQVEPEISKAARDAAFAEMKDQADWIPSHERPTPYGFHVQKAITAENAALREEVGRLKEQLDWQNQPNRNPASRGGYEFYVNEEWTAIRDAAMDTDPGFHASLLKRRYDPDDERVRVRLVRDDDALLADITTLRDRVKELEGALNEARKSLNLAGYYHAADRASLALKGDGE